MVVGVGGGLGAGVGGVLGGAFLAEVGLSFGSRCNAPRLLSVARQILERKLAVT